MYYIFLWEVEFGSAREKYMYGTPFSTATNTASLYLDPYIPESNPANSLFVNHWRTHSTVGLGSSWDVGVVRELYPEQFQPQLLLHLIFSFLYRTLLLFLLRGATS